MAQLFLFGCRRGLMKKFFTLAAAAATIACQFLAPSVIPAAQAQQGPATATKLVFYNASNIDVPVGVQVPGFCVNPAACAQEDGCPTGTVQTLRWLDLSVNGAPQPLIQFGAPTKGWFLLKRGHRVQLLNTGINKYTGQPSACLQGMNFGFGTFAAICPDSTANPVGPSTFPITTPGPTLNNSKINNEPNGTNGFECTINLPGTVNGKTVINDPSNPANLIGAPSGESMDITCVNGANCTLQVQVTPPSTGPFWTADGNATNFRSTVSFQNSWVDIAHKCDNNCIDPRTGVARPGVFPYGCTQCNAFPDPAPPCTGAGVPSAQFCAAKNGFPPNNGCKFNRSATVAGVQKFGGTIQVNYLGPLSPPGTCPPGTHQ